MATRVVTPFVHQELAREAPGIRLNRQPYKPRDRDLRSHDHPRDRVNELRVNAARVEKATQETQPRHNGHNVGDEPKMPDVSIETVDGAARPLRKTQTVPDNLSGAGRRMSAGSEAVKPQKQHTGRFNQFRRASAVFLEEMIHLHKEPSSHKAGPPGSHGLKKHQSLRRRLSLSDMFHRKTPGRNESDDSLEEQDITQKDYLTDKICVWFPSTLDESHKSTDSIYQLNGSTQNPYFVSAFGQKGSGKGDFQDIKDITILQGDRVLLTDWVLGRINLCQKTGRPLIIYSGTCFAESWASVDLGNKQIAVTSRKDHCVRIFSIEGEVLNSFGENFFKFPAGIAVDKDGHLIVCDAKTNKVTVHDRTGVLVRYIGNGDDHQQKFKTPRYACVLHTGEIVVSDSGNHCVKLFTPTGKFITSFGGFGSGSGQMKSPYGVCANRRCEIFVSDHYNNRISVFSRDGKFLRNLVTSEHGLRHPQALSIGSDRKLYVSHGKLKASEILTFDLNTR